MFEATGEGDMYISGLGTATVGAVTVGYGSVT